MPRYIINLPLRFPLDENVSDFVYIQYTVGIHTVVNHCGRKLCIAESFPNETSRFLLLFINFYVFHLVCLHEITVV